MASQHSDVVRSVSFSADGSLLASASHDRMVHMWKHDTKKLAQRKASRHLVFPETEWKMATCLLWSNDGNFMAIGGDNVVVWDMRHDAAYLARKWTLQGHSKTVMCLAFSPGGHILASGSKDRCLNLWDVAPGDHERLKVSLKAHEADLTCVAWSPDGNTIASASADKTVLVWGKFIWARHEGDKDLKSQPVTLAGHEAEVTCVAWAVNGILLASCGRDMTVKVWNFSGSPDMKKDIQAPALTCTLCADMMLARVCWSTSGALLSASGTGDISPKPGGSPLAGDRTGFSLMSGSGSPTKSAFPNSRRWSATNLLGDTAPMHGLDGSPSQSFSREMSGYGPGSPRRGTEKRVAVWRPTSGGVFEEVGEDQEEESAAMKREKGELIKRVRDELVSAKATAMARER